MRKKKNKKKYKRKTQHTAIGDKETVLNVKNKK